MARSVHYEIFRRQGSKGGWSLHDALDRRDDAIEAAKTLVAEGGATGAKVVKETYDEATGDYLSLKIFEDGHTRSAVAPQAEDVPSALPCFKPDDLYAYHARATMTRLLAEPLARWRITVTELIHRADALERLEATGTLYQHAIQMVAVAQASATGRPVAEIVKALNELVGKATKRVYRDAREQRLPTAGPGGFAALADRLGAEPGGDYAFRTAVAADLAPADSWRGKLDRLLAIALEGPQSEPGRALLTGTVDQIVSEMLSGAAALADLIGRQEDRGEALLVLAGLLLGQAPPSGADGLAALGAEITAGHLPAARTALAGRVLAELRSQKRLCPGSVTREVDVLRRLATKLVMASGPHLDHHDVLAAFVVRSRRLVTPETIEALMGEADGYEDRIRRLLAMEENVIGAENKRQLSTFLLPLLTSNQAETIFVDGRDNVLARLGRLAEMQRKTAGSGIPDAPRRQIIQAMGALGRAAAERARLFEALERNARGDAEAAMAWLKLAGSGALTEGGVLEAARDRAQRALDKPGFRRAFLEWAAGQNRAPAEAMAELDQLTARAGLGPEPVAAAGGR